MVTKSLKKIIRASIKRCCVYLHGVLLWRRNSVICGINITITIMDTVAHLDDTLLIDVLVPFTQFSNFTRD